MDKFPFLSSRQAMLFDIASQQQLHEVFASNHCSHKRNSSTTTSNTTMTNGQRYIIDDLGTKADQILGRAPTVVDYGRQPSIDFGHPRPPSRVLISEPTSRVNHEQVSSVPNSNPSIKPSKERMSVTYDQLIPLISKLLDLSPYKRLPEQIFRPSKNHVIDRQDLFGDETDLNLSEDENEAVDDENQNEIIPHSNSEAENDDELHATNPHPISLMDFLTTGSSPGTQQGKRSLTPPISVKPIKRKEELIKSFSSSVNIPIDPKQPILPITIPTHLFFDSNSHTDDERAKSASSKRIVTDSNEPSTQPKKSKTSHVYNSNNVKEEPMMLSTNQTFTQESQAAIPPTTVPIKKEKPTANVKPLLQSTMMENSSSPNPANAPDRLTTTSANRTNYANLRTMSTKELNALAREKKKQADGEKRTFEDVRQSMCLYLESVCYFIRCAHDEPIVEQRNSLQTATLNMLQHLVYNYQKMFHIPNNPSTELLNNIRQKFLIINYWLQSYIYYLQFNTNFSTIERCASQVTEYFSHSRSPADVNHNFIYEFSKHMLNSYHSNYYWNKAERLLREELSRRFLEQLLRQNSNRHLARDYSTLEYLLYIIDAIDLLRTTSA